MSLTRFAVTYVVLMGIAFNFLIGFEPVVKVFNFNRLYTDGVVAVTASVLRALSIPCTPQGSILELPSISLDVKFGCNGLEAVLIYSVAVLAFPSSWKKKLAGVTAGFLILQVANIMRITALAYSGIHFKNYFQYIHIYVAQGIMIAVALGIFFVYLTYAQKGEPFH